MAKRDEPDDRLAIGFSLPRLAAAYRERNGGEPTPAVSPYSLSARRRTHGEPWRTEVQPRALVATSSLVAATRILLATCGDGVTLSLEPGRDLIDSRYWFTSMPYFFNRSLKFAFARAKISSESFALKTTLEVRS
jgi:hypothetical protein